MTLFNTHFGLIRPENMLVIRPYCTSTNGEQDGQALQDLKPSWVIMYDPDVGFVRRLESFKALHRKRELKVYFMVYDNSVEEQRYLSAIRKEKASFEKMIRQKSVRSEKGERERDKMRKVNEINPINTPHTPLSDHGYTRRSRR